MGDNIVASLGNFSLVFLTAKYGSGQNVGALSLIIATYSVTLTLSRNVTGQALLLAPSAAGRSHAMLYWSMVQGAVATVVLAPFGLLDWVGAPYFAILAASVPFLLSLDAARFIAFAEGKPLNALILDFTWTGLQLIGSILFLRNGLPSTALAVAWGAAAVIAVLPALMRHSRYALAVPQLLRAEIRLIRSLGVEGLITAGGAQVVTLLMAASISLNDLGIVRVAYTLLGPLLLVQTAILPFCLSRVATDPSPRTLRAVIGVSTCLPAVMCASGVLAEVVPQAWVRLILGETGVNAQNLFPLAGVSAGLTSAAAAVLQVARPFNAGRRTLGLRALAVAGDAVAVLAGGALGGATSVMTALVLAELGTLTIVSVVTTRSVRAVVPTA